MWIIKLFLAAAAVYAALVALMYAAQTMLLFPVRQTAPPQGPLPEASRRLEIAAPGGNRLAGIHIPASAPAPGSRTLILGFAGNAWNAESMAVYVHELFPEADVAAFHYRGYPPSTGRPAAAALLSDALLVHDYAIGEFAPARLIVAGFSIGAGVAAHLAAARPVAGLILVTPFDSLSRLVAGRYPWLPVRALLRHHMDAIGALRKVDAPAALIAAGSDTLVPPARTAPLRAAAKNLVLDRIIAGATHTDIYHDQHFRAAMHEALALMERR